MEITHLIDRFEYLFINSQTIYFENGDSQYVSSFHISKKCVTIRQFQDFCKITGYKTKAEQAGSRTYLENELIEHLNDAERMDATAYCLSYSDACIFCEWQNTQLPTEAEWMAMSLCDQVIYDIKNPKACPWVDKHLNIKSLQIFSIKLSGGYELTETHISPTEIVARVGPWYFRWSDWNDYAIDNRLIFKIIGWDLMSTFRTCIRMKI